MRTVEVTAVCDSDEVTSNYHETYFFRGEEKRGEEIQYIIRKGEGSETAETAQ